MSTREIATQVFESNDGADCDFCGALCPDDAGKLINAIDAALTKAIADEQERAVRIFESHTQSIECDHENSCVEETIAAIRRDSTGEEGS